MGFVFFGVLVFYSCNKRVKLVDFKVLGYFGVYFWFWVGVGVDGKYGGV